MPNNENIEKKRRKKQEKPEKKGSFFGVFGNGLGRKKADSDGEQIVQQVNNKGGASKKVANPVALNLAAGEPNDVVPAAEEKEGCRSEKGNPVATKGLIIREKGGRQDGIKRRWWNETSAKLTIFLLENSSETRDPEFWDFIKSEVIARHLADFVSESEAGYVCFIRYADSVSSGALQRVDNDFDLNQIVLSPGLQSDKLTLYEAIQRLRSVVRNSLNREDLYYKGTPEKIKEIRVIGIGRGIDSGSVNPKSRALDTLSEILSRKNVTNKYYCLSEDDFPHVAALGFRNIVSMTDRALEIFDSE